MINFKELTESINNSTELLSAYLEKYGLSYNLELDGIAHNFFPSVGLRTISAKEFLSILETDKLYFGGFQKSQLPEEYQDEYNKYRSSHIEGIICEKIFGEVVINKLESKYGYYWAYKDKIIELLKDLPEEELYKTHTYYLTEDYDIHYSGWVSSHLTRG